MDKEATFAHKKLVTISLLALLILSMCIQSFNLTSGQIEHTTSKLQAANTAVNQAFNAVLDAEKAGANVTDLLVQINTAQGILAQAENSNEPETPTQLQLKQTAFSQ